MHFQYEVFVYKQPLFSGIVVFNWVLFALTIFGMFIVFDPLGSVKYGESLDTPSQSRHHKKVTGLWSRRFRWACCCLKKDEYGDEAFQQVAGHFHVSINVFICIYSLVKFNRKILSIFLLIYLQLCSVQFFARLI